MKHIYLITKKIYKQQKTNLKLFSDNYVYIINFNNINNMTSIPIKYYKNIFIQYYDKSISLENIVLNKWYDIKNIKIKLSHDQITNANEKYDNYNACIIKKPIYEYTKYYVYNLKFKTLIPDDNMSILHKFSECFNYKQFRVWITKTTVMMIIFNSTLLGKYLINKANIDLTKYIISGYTFRNIFNRRLKRKYEQKTKLTSDLYSAATSKIQYINTEKGFPNIIIKNSKFDYHKIIKHDLLFDPINLIIFRLSIYDYHHFYMPTSGILLDYYYLGDDFQSVGYKFIYSHMFNPLNDNFRLVLKFKYVDSEFIFYLIIIGSTIVGSIKTEELIINKTYKTFEHMGNFDLGGSCIVFLTNKKIDIKKKIKYYSLKCIETYMTVFDKL